MHPLISALLSPKILIAVNSVSFLQSALYKLRACPFVKLGGVRLVALGLARVMYIFLRAERGP
jgi:hypothetical protein